jgi:flagellar hook assembly protein FlgD
VYSPGGQLVRTLVDAYVSAGDWEVPWDGTDDAGTPLASGVYLYRLRAGGLTQSRKMILLK